MSFGAQTAAIVMSLLIVAGVFVALSGNTEPSTVASTQAAATSLESLRHPLQGIVNGWNTSIGTEHDRLAEAKHFNFKVADDEQLWRNNSLTPFVGKVLRATKIEITKRNLFNRIIEWYINHKKVEWTVTPGPQGIKGDIIENIDGTYIRRFTTAGWASPSIWLERDVTKNFPPLPLPLPPIPGGGLIDWGVQEVISSTETSIVLHWSSYQKGEIVVTWDLVQ